jgi:hypothetical protein
LHWFAANLSLLELKKWMQPKACWCVLHSNSLNIHDTYEGDTAENQPLLFHNEPEEDELPKVFVENETGAEMEEYLESLIGAWTATFTHGGVETTLTLWFRGWNGYGMGSEGVVDIQENNNSNFIFPRHIFTRRVSSRTVSFSIEHPDGRRWGCEGCFNGPRSVSGTWELAGTDATITRSHSEKSFAESKASPGGGEIIGQGVGASTFPWLH